MSPFEPTQPQYRAGIIGLGQIGNLFDEDLKRKEIWSHTGAYLALPDVVLAAGADSDAGRRNSFLKRSAGAKAYHDYRDMLKAERLDVVSVCTPTALHHEMVLAAVHAGVRAVFCEKPLAATPEQAAEMVEICQSAGVSLAVNHTRRWEPIYVRAKQLVEEGAIGRIEAIVGYYPGKVFTMGTHLFDLMRFFGGDVQWVCGQSWNATMASDEEGSLSGQLQFCSGATGSIISGWDRTNHVFELDLVGSAGRLRLSGDGAAIDLWRFKESPRYSGYRELAKDDEIGRTSEGSHPLVSRLVTAMRDVIDCIGNGQRPACSGPDGLAAVDIACALRESVAQGNSRVELPLVNSVSICRT
ncbi:MAG: Gfo/Idh/MocA family oxidoreductase [Nitrospirota bacterium]|nr:Gfo/Idh/MocA family oxidoreductase [Nitrospirota bacterium]MDP2383770.1 Gfo/Idh/MocA family oxidoreductase [Nitrospirota bacterium]